MSIASDHMHATCPVNGSPPHYRKQPGEYHSKGSMQTVMTRQQLSQGHGPPNNASGNTPQEQKNRHQTARCQASGWSPWSCRACSSRIPFRSPWSCRACSSRIPFRSLRTCISRQTGLSPVAFRPLRACRTSITCRPPFTGCPCRAGVATLSFISLRP